MTYDLLEQFCAPHLPCYAHFDNHVYGFELLNMLDFGIKRPAFVSPPDQCAVFLEESLLSHLVFLSIQEDNMDNDKTSGKFD